MPDIEQTDRYYWTVNVPLATNRFVLRQLAFVLFFPAILVALFIFILGVIDGDPDEMKAALSVFALVAGIFLVLMAIAILLVFGNRMEMAFDIKPDGVHSHVIDKRARFGRLLAIAAGFLTLNPTLAGLGLVAHGNRGRHTAWRDIKEIELLVDQFTIVLHGKRLPLDAVFCLENNYDAVLSAIRSRLT
ncbi:hypothetical protein [uncultured Cohaesibacter sp.]|uniref:hypothetical protein n=1 Tax=uncultured Cohaesibacter sp. TaxID=1002546 RepID=UPI0029C9A797|nr:hypothetical protein [uncultured Cohaesibacter sp.]